MSGNAPHLADAPAATEPSPAPLSLGLAQLLALIVDRRARYPDPRHYDCAMGALCQRVQRVLAQWPQARRACRLDPQALQLLREVLTVQAEHCDPGRYRRAMRPLCAHAQALLQQAAPGQLQDTAPPPPPCAVHPGGPP